MKSPMALAAVLTVAFVGSAVTARAETLRLDYSDGPPSPLNDYIGAVATWTQPSDVTTFTDPSFPLSRAFDVSDGSFSIVLPLYGQSFSGPLNEVAFDSSDFYLISPSVLFQGSPPPFSVVGSNELVLTPGVYQTAFGETWTITAIPETASWIMMIFGLGGIGAVGRGVRRSSVPRS